MKRLLLATVLCTLIGAAPAAACSSAGASTQVQRRLAAADAAFVGRVVAHRTGGVVVFRVGVHVKGRLGHRVRVRWTDSCAAPPSRRTGLLLHRVRRHWEATRADVVRPGELLKTAGIGP